MQMKNLKTIINIKIYQNNKINNNYINNRKTKYNLNETIKNKRLKLNSSHNKNLPNKMKKFLKNLQNNNLKTL